MLHGGPVRFRKKWSGPPEIEITFISINPISVHEIFVVRGKGGPFLHEPRVFPTIWQVNG